ncbi:zinc finger protein Xfin-like [Limulus polyphemus]|uniref:Zinc finger protein Xfin-like n=1 Tax=Limulus polyphemus TaxID=6850 RepID=A0ABM1SF54_LIMPO|nr:zinc finger protein Xfin-like [Limulus polyphemus]XP_022242259.1 zinc finger protein Xfin-like [Limulus polyphemus]
MEKHHCPFCPVYYFAAGPWERHIHKKHKDELIRTLDNAVFYKCELCDACYYKEDLLKSHIEAEHHKIFKKVAISDGGSKNQDSFQTVGQVPATKPHTSYSFTTNCPFCTELFSSQVLVVKHAERNHKKLLKKFILQGTGEPKYQCLVCSAKFFEKKYLEKHRKFNIHLVKQQDDSTTGTSKSSSVSAKLTNKGQELQKSNQQVHWKLNEKKKGAYDGVSGTESQIYERAEHNFKNTKEKQRVEHKYEGIVEMPKSIHTEDKKLGRCSDVEVIKSSLKYPSVSNGENSRTQLCGTTRASQDVLTDRGRNGALGHWSLGNMPEIEGYQENRTKTGTDKNIHIQNAVVYKRYLPFGPSFGYESELEKNINMKGKLNSSRCFCCVCNMSFSNHGDLEKHFLVDHGVSNMSVGFQGNQKKSPVQSELGNDERNCNSSWSLHRDKHCTDNPESIVTCPLCASHFPSQLLFNIHSWSHADTNQVPHFFASTMYCCKCKKTFNSRSQFFSHTKEVHNDVRHLCEFCPTFYYSQSALSRHLSRNHEEEVLLLSKELPKFVCVLCSARFYFADPLVHHLQQHDGYNSVITEEHYPPNQCLSSSRVGKKQEPKLKPGEPTVMCIGCSKPLNSEKQEKHSTDTEQISLASRCNVKSMYNKEIGPTRLHSTVMHNKKTESGVEARNNIRYSCAYCGGVFSSSSLLQEHIKSHKKLSQFLKPLYGCAKCSAKFYQNRYLRHHLRFHHGSKVTPRKCHKSRRNTASVDVSSVRVQKTSSAGHVGSDWFSSLRSNKTSHGTSSTSSLPISVSLKENSVFSKDNPGSSCQATIQEDNPGKRKSKSIQCTLCHHSCDSQSIMVRHLKEFHRITKFETRTTDVQM